MRLAGKRFWTWISVAMLSVFVKSEGGALAQEQSTTNTPSSTQLKHNVPPGPNSKARSTQDKRKGQGGGPNGSQLSTPVLRTEGKTFPKTTSSPSYLQDASSKDAAKMTMKSGLKTPSAASVVGEKRDLQTGSGLKTSIQKTGGEDTPTESLTRPGYKSSGADNPTESFKKSKHYPHKKPK